MSRSAPATFDGFVHADGGRLVDGQGRPRLLRGVGLGNWLLPEGYMWHFANTGPQSPRQIEAFIQDLIGPTEAAGFWRTFRDRFIAEDDIERIAADGFDHVRLPINARFVIDDDSRLLDEGIGRIDSLIEWCRTHGLWVILDLHGAPGGQTGTNIDDSPRGLPDLFLEGGSYRALTVSLWEQLAMRYRDEPVVAGYDLLNEPLPNEYQDRFAADLVALYRELTDAIRAADPHHLIIYEGTHWSTNWSIFTDVWDANSMLQFHKYWSPPDRPSIAGFIETGRRLGLPIYMGEGGENNVDWLQTAFRLYEDCGISWNLWPWKKVDTITSPRSIPAPVGWPAMTAYADGSGPRPSDALIGAALGELLEGLPLGRTEERTDVLNAVFQRAPLRIPATGFGFIGAGVSYHTRAAQALTSFRSDDLITIRHGLGSVDEPDFGHNDGRARGRHERLEVVLDEGEWLTYEVDITPPSAIEIRVETTGWPPDAAPTVAAGGNRLAATATGRFVTARSPGAVGGAAVPVKVTAKAPGTAIAGIEIARLP